MNRKEFINEVSRRKGISHTKAYHSVNAVMDTIRMLLQEGNEIEIGGFGTFLVITDLKGECVPVFKVGSALRNVLNTFENGKKESNG